MNIEAHRIGKSAWRKPRYLSPGQEGNVLTQVWNSRIQAAGGSLDVFINDFCGQSPELKPATDLVGRVDQVPSLTTFHMVPAQIDRLASLQVALNQQGENPQTHTEIAEPQQTISTKRKSILERLFSRINPL